MKAMLQKNPHLFWSFIVPWDSRICQLRQRTTSKSHGLLEASVIAHNFCCPHPRISQGRGSVRGEPLTGSPTRVQSPARRRPVLRCKTVPTRKKTRFCVSFFVLVRPTGFEPAAYRVGVCHSIQLSYGRIFGCRCTSSLGIIAVLPTDVKPFWKNFFAERLLKKLTTIVSCGRISP